MVVCKWSLSRSIMYLPPGQKARTVFLHITDVCVIHDIHRGIRFNSLISTYIHKQRHGRIKLVLPIMPWVCKVDQDCFLVYHVIKMGLILVPDFSRYYTYNTTRPVLLVL